MRFVRWLAMVCAILCAAPASAQTIPAPDTPVVAAPATAQTTPAPDAQVVAAPVTAQITPAPGVHVEQHQTVRSTRHNQRAEMARQQEKTAEVIRIALILTMMAVLPAIVISTTSFLRTVVVLSMIRHAFGMPETPPNQMIIALSLFLTVICMSPTFEAVSSRALTPFLDGKASVQEAIDNGSGPLRDFMLRQVRDQDIKAVYDMSHKPLPKHASEVNMLQLVPAFMLNELRVAFRIGFVIMLPFLLIDVVVSCILVSLGMLMVPPSTLSLPIKVLMFVLIDGWSLTLQGVISSFR